MILTVTINPSMDYIYFVEDFKLDGHNRVENPTQMIGGKGINSGRVSATLGSDVFLTGFLGGNTGNLIKDELLDEAIYSDISFVNHKDSNRNAITIMHNKGKQTELVEKGIQINKEDYHNLLVMIFGILLEHPEIKIICLSGSANYKDSIYVDLINDIKAIKHFKYLKFITDISGNKLKCLIESNTEVELIKPNISELGDIVGKELINKLDVIDTLKELSLENIKTVMVSCGGNGAVIKHNNKIYDVNIPKVKIVNTTGSGDSTVGGFAYAIDKNFNFIDSIKLAMACGISNALNKGVGEIEKEQVLKLIDKIKINEI